MEKVMPISISTLSKLAGIEASVISSTLFEEKEGVKVPVANQALIDKTIEDALNKKLTSMSTDLEEKNKRAGRLEVYTEVETEAKALGIDMKWNEHKFSKLKEKFASNPNPATTEVDITKDERFIKVVTDNAALIKSTETKYQDIISGLHKDATTNAVKRWSLAKVTDEKSGLTQYAMPVAVNLNDLAVKQTMSKVDELGLTIKVDSVNGQDVFSLVDNDGKPYRDPNNSYSEVNFEQFHLGIAKQGFFPQMAAPNITSGGAGQTQQKVFKKTVGEKETEYKLPDNLKNMSEVEFSDWTMKAQGDGAPSEMITEANNQYFKKE